MKQAGLTGMVGVVCLCGVGTLRAGPPAFPGALGFGANATGGRGGTVYHVTTLADSGPGSFRDAVSQPNRIVVFDVGGYVTLQSGVSVRENITIAGQTAPGGGIGFKGDEISFGKRSNIICRHIRVRPGSETDSNGDVGISLYDARNIILDHVSIEFAPWNNVGAVSDDWQNWPVTDVTFQHCLNANPTYQQFGAHTESVQSRMAWFLTLFANSHNRNPMSKINDLFINNVLYNCSAGYTTHTSTEFSHDIVNNYFIAGPASGSNLPWYQVDNNQSIYCSGNYYDSDRDGALGGSLTTVYWYQGPPYGTVLTSPWSSLTSTSVLYSARTAFRVAVSRAGAWPRDAMDDLVISQVKTLGYGPVGPGAATAGPDGALYTSQTQTGLPNNGYGIIAGGAPPQDSDGDGMADFFEQANGYDLGRDDAMTIGPDGYARIETYINWLADPHASTTTNTPVIVDLWDYTSGFTNASPVYAVGPATNGTVALSNSHFAVFTPIPAFIGMGGFQFAVAASDGSAYTSAVSVAISALQPPKNLRWRGDGSANVWTTNGPANWFDGMNLVAFASGDNVTFDDTGSNSPPISLPGPVTAGSIHCVASQDYTIRGSGRIMGGASLHKAGPGRLTLSTLNTFTGGTTIHEGIMQLGDGLTANGSLVGNVTNHATLVFANPSALTASCSVTGPGQFIKTAAGKLTLSGDQSYTGPTRVDAGIVEFAGTPPAGHMTNNGVVAFKPASSLTLAQTICGSGSVEINAAGQTVTLSGANLYTGGTTNTAGTLQLAHDRAAGSGPVTYLAGAIKVGNGVVITNTFVLPASTSDLMLDTFGGGTCTWAGDVQVTGGGASFRPGGTDGKLVLTGNAAMGARNFIVPKGSVEFAGNARFSATGTATAFGRNSTANSAFVTVKDNAVVSLGKLNLGGGQATGGRITVTIQDNGSLSTGTEDFDLHNSTRTATWTAIYLNGGTLAVGGFGKTMTGASQLTTNYFNGGLLVATKPNPSFLPALSGLTCLVQAGGARIHNNSGGTITISQPLLHDPALGTTPDGGLTVWGAVILQGVHTFTGPTTVLLGTLFVTSSNTIAASPSVYVEQGATLDTTSAPGFTLANSRLWGNGTVNGEITLGAGSVLSPGSNRIGRLTFLSPVTLSDGSTCVFELDKGGRTNDVVVAAAGLRLGGTLRVTNLSGSLTAGDAFRLVEGPVAGSFRTLSLPPLGHGLAWTNELTTPGTIRVISTSPSEPPVFSSIRARGHDLVISGSNGPPLGVFVVLTSTNLAIPRSQWAVLATNQFDASGRFCFTNAIGGNARFYLLQVAVP